MPPVNPNDIVLVHYPTGLREPVTPGEAFARISENLCRVLNAFSKHYPAVLLLAIRFMVNRTNARFQALAATVAAQIAAGVLPGRARRRVRAARRRTPVDPDAPWVFSEQEIAEPWRVVRLPGGKLWLVKLFGHHAAGFGPQLEHLLKDPAVQAMLAASPAMVRLLRRFAAALGLDADLVPSLPKRGGTGRAADERSGSDAQDGQSAERDPSGHADSSEAAGQSGQPDTSEQRGPSAEPDETDQPRQSERRDDFDQTGQSGEPGQSENSEESAHSQTPAQPRRRRAPRGRPPVPNALPVMTPQGQAQGMGQAHPDTIAAFERYAEAQRQRAIRALSGMSRRPIVFSTW